MIFILLIVLSFVALSSGFCLVPPTVDSVNVTQYLGEWYQVYIDPLANNTIQRDCGCSRAFYSLDEKKGPGYIGVCNTARCGSDGADGKAYSIEGYAWQPNPSKFPGRLSVVLNGAIFPIPFPYWVIMLGSVVDDQYSQETLSQADVETISAYIEKHGFEKRQIGYEPQGSQCAYVPCGGK